MPQAIHISPIDNVVVALHPIAKGNNAAVGNVTMRQWSNTALAPPKMKSMLPEISQSL